MPVCLPFLAMGACALLLFYIMTHCDGEPLGKGMGCPDIVFPMGENWGLWFLAIIAFMGFSLLVLMVVISYGGHHTGGIIGFVHMSTMKEAAIPCAAHSQTPMSHALHQISAGGFL